MFELDPVQKFHRDAAREFVLKLIEEERRRKINECMKYWLVAKGCCEFEDASFIPLDD